MADLNLVYAKAMDWIRRNNIKGNGIAVFGGEKESYPEVTGYYIPTLLKYKQTELAKEYCNWLCSIQNEDGSWNAPDNSAAYVFDSAQILKGLLAIYEEKPEIENNIIRGCNWIISNMQSDGRLTTPIQNAWGNGRFCSELVHLYCLSPIFECAKVFHNNHYYDAGNKILSYYLENKMDKILDFHLLSHFYAYILEGLIDVGRQEIVRKALVNLENESNWNGIIPGIKGASWVCSTGLFQMALVYYKMGEKNKGDIMFEYACELQNESGGWYGSYLSPKAILKFRKKNKPEYFPQKEISWANKYFLDAFAEYIV